MRKSIGQINRSGAAKGRFVLLVEIIESLPKALSKEEESMLGEKLMRVARQTEYNPESGDDRFLKSAALHKMAAFYLAEGGNYTTAKQELGRCRWNVEYKEASPDFPGEVSSIPLLRRESSEEEIAVDSLILEAMEAFIKHDPNRKRVHGAPEVEITKMSIERIEVLLHNDAQRRSRKEKIRRYRADVLKGSAKTLLGVATIISGYELGVFLDLPGAAQGIPRLIGLSLGAILAYDGDSQFWDGIKMLRSEKKIHRFIKYHKEEPRKPEAQKGDDDDAQGWESTD